MQTKKNACPLEIIPVVFLFNISSLISVRSPKKSYYPSKTIEYGFFDWYFWFLLKRARSEPMHDYLNPAHPYVEGIICKSIFSGIKPVKKGFVKPLFALTILLSSFNSFAQSISEIITDYQGYWKSSTTAINPVKPNNSHNLLSFSYNGTRYSTGVNDALLNSRGDHFVAGDYRALPFHSFNGTVNSNTKIGVGAMYDGVAVGAGIVRPVNNIPYYLTDGVKGLDIGTCVANLPAGTIFFSVGNIKPSSIGDGIPDVIITQIADPSTNSFDRYQFTDVNGNNVGNHKDIILNTIIPVGNWMADFYEASTNPMALTSGFTNTQRPFRLWAADFSEFGITTAHLSSIAYFRITLSGNSDVAFVSYNHDAINFSLALPVELSSFKATKTNESVNVAWETTSEANSDRFILETSRDGTHFTSLAEKKAAGYSSLPLRYSYLHTDVDEGANYYRLKQVDQDGKIKYSKIIVVDIASTSTIRLFPNPATSHVVIYHPPATGNEQLQILSLSGIAVFKSMLEPGASQTILTNPGLSKGTYVVVITGLKKIYTRTLIIQ